MVSSSKTLSKEEEFLICLTKLRMNYLFKDIAYHLNVSVSTIQRSFHSTLDVMYARLQFLVKWPTRENLRKSMPQCFRRDFGQRVVVIMDCFELFSETPSSACSEQSVHLFQLQTSPDYQISYWNCTPRGSDLYLARMGWKNFR